MEGLDVSDKSTSFGAGALARRSTLSLDLLAHVDRPRPETEEHLGATPNTGRAPSRQGGTVARATAIRRGESRLATGRKSKQAAMESQVQVLGNAEVVVRKSHTTCTMDLRVNLCHSTIQ
jgi:hypothetical protein